MIPINIIILIIICHWVADFLLQDSEWSLHKSEDIGKLFLHTLTYGIFFFVSLINFFWFSNNAIPLLEIFYFTLITFVTHSIIDFFTSRKTKKMYNKKQFGSSVPNWGMFTVIGLDQSIHFIQLFTTYSLIFN